MERKATRDHVPRIQTAMTLTGITARRLSRETGVDHTLICKWQRGHRTITMRTKQLNAIATALLDSDADGALHEALAPFHDPDATLLDTMRVYLTGEDIEGLTPYAQAPSRRFSGDYEVHYKVYLGKKGFRKAVLALMDYVQTIPPGQDIYVLCQGQYEWITGNLPFIIQFIAKLRRAVQRGTHLRLVNRRGYTITETAAFAGPWLLAHLQGYIRSRYYDGDMPDRLRFAVSIPGFLSGHVEEDPEVEDNLFAAMYTDPRDIRQDAAVVEEYYANSDSASQYGFLKKPLGGGDDLCLWHDGPLPAWKDGPAPTGNFSAVVSVPAFGIITRAEYDEIRGQDAPPVPPYIFAGSDTFAPGRHRIILCREDIIDGLKGQRRKHDALSELLGRRAFISCTTLRAQLNRICDAMERDDFEVAILPRIAFSKLMMEIVCWENSVSVAWLQNLDESVFADDKATSGSFYGAIDYVWDKLLAGWKSQDAIRRQLRKWIAGRDLGKVREDSAVVKKWDAFRRE